MALVANGTLPDAKRESIVATRELMAIGLTILLWFLVEPLGFKAPVLLLLIVGWSFLYVRRAVQDPTMLWRWGFRLDNFKESAIWLLVVAAAWIGAMVVFWLIVRPGPLPDRVSWLLVVYPVWALLQQFVLQHVLVANCRRVGVGERWLPLIGGAGFALAHAPDWPLMLLTGAGGGFWTWAFWRHPNLPLLALTHAAVGAAAFFLLLGRDPIQEFPELAALS